ncbi:phosphatidate cytidylyltransferase [Methylomonas sp. SURF-2]|uniref:Phosphatidate cytidylyltransferase n=1 Tax=Methylomonas subterranea TaxID=2952225 RepID=A0ABT1TCM4_9GAMM|nr:phosphatidate cytidylyltransferase [Methylomonas sp. SURF-2]MCQ8103211.1 phosphatidate cytidylyltransferase [Methylomonas sp. SURF-2]
MLVQRILTALVLAAVVILAVFQLPAVYFSLFIAIVTLGGAWEWLSLTGVEQPGKKCLFFAALIFPMLGVTYWTVFLELLGEALEWPEIKEYSDALEWLVIAPVLFWVLAMIIIRQAAGQLLQTEFKPRAKAFVGWLVLLSAWMFLSKLRAYYGPGMVLYFLVLIWAADISAYFVGKKWGKDKLAPEISPGKTVQGMYGALLSAVICAIGLRIYYGLEALQSEEASLAILMSVDLLILSVLTVLVSIYGDLFFSLVKRQKGVKDSGSLLPGHGGILDRVDSLIAAAPFFYAGIVLIGRSVFA